MIEFTFYDYISNAVLGGTWYNVLTNAFLIIILYNWFCTFFRKPGRSEWVARNYAGMLLMLLYVCYNVFVYIQFRAEAVRPFDYARLVTTILKYSIGLNIYFLIREWLLRVAVLKSRKEITGFLTLFSLFFIYDTMYQDLQPFIQHWINNVFFEAKGIKPITNDGVDMGLYYFYSNVVAAFIFASANSIINNFIARQRQKDMSAELELTTLKNHLLKTQIESLNSRINPHFLYNALNSIAALTFHDAARSRSMIIMLSKLFRYNVNREEEAFTEIEAEAEMIKSYLDIEKVRFEDNLSFTLTIAEAVKNMKMPRFLLQPLIENAIKYGLNIHAKLSVGVHIFYEKNQLILQVTDNGNEFPDNLIPGYGFKSVQDKLSLLYPENYEMSIIKAPVKMVEIRITTPLN